MGSQHDITGTNLRICKLCHKIKPLEEYYRNKGNYRDTTCIACKSDLNKKRMKDAEYAENKREYVRKYSKTHKEAVSKRLKSYRDKNKDKISKYYSEWYNQNRERIIADRKSKPKPNSNYNVVTYHIRADQMSILMKIARYLKIPYIDVIRQALNEAKERVNANGI